MLISDLIEELEDTLEKFGDLPIFVFDNVYGEMRARRVEYSDKVPKLFPERIIIG